MPYTLTPGPSQDRYRELCQSEPSIPLFSQAWWLDVVAPGAWDALLVEENGRIVGCMPYTVSRKYGLRLSSQPPLTQALGPWVRPSRAKPVKALSHEFGVLGQLAEGLPAVDRFLQNWDFRQHNWLPFYWNGFSQTTRYTYRLENLDDVDALWSNVRESIRTDVRKASTRFGVTVRNDLTVADLLRLNRMVFERQELAVPYSDSLVQLIDRVAAARGQRQVLIAEDLDGRHHAGAFIVWDETSAYYLLGGADPELRSSGATSLCLWEAIKHASTVTSSFDFEGSMIKGVERHFRAFGARQTPYFQIRRTTSRRARLAETARSVLRK